MSKPAKRYSVIKRIVTLTVSLNTLFFVTISALVIGIYLFSSSIPLDLTLIILIAFVIAIVIFLLLTKLLIVIINKNLEPINQLSILLEEVKNGNFYPKAKIEKNNELSDISKVVEEMSNEIDRQERIAYENYAYDQLTGLKTREAITEEVNKKIFTEDKKAAVCLLQIVNYKDIVVIKGQEVANNLINKIASQLTDILNEDNQLFSKSEDELVYIVQGFNSLSEVQEKTDKIIAHFKEPNVIKDIRIEIKIFAGIATYPTDGNDLDELIKKCDLSLYRAKQTMKKQLLFYNDTISQEIAYQAEITEQLSQALESDEIHLKYQPLIDFKAEIYGFEALARWSSPVVGDISPEIFIGNAEQSYMIIPIGNYILRESCKAQVAMKKKFDREFMMSVNVSLIQLLQADFVEKVKEIVNETNINPNYLTLELTESIFINATIALDDKIDEMHKLGIKFSLDDFGTGYSSLTYLQKIAFDNLKIDKSFIDGVLELKKEHRIVETIVNLVHRLDMKVIAEGVESRKQLEYLRHISADIIQGYIFSPPLNLQDANEYIDKFYKLSPKTRLNDIMKKND
ncbi:MAG: EAL domain-containing protein [Candidatus Izimaplasma sp.]|nr:EAL domain-containing protein [Candidatus Izimaplasma bacterium]